MNPSTLDAALLAAVRTLLVISATGFVAGAGWGLYRGADYPPTEWAAAIEGSVVVGVPGVVVATLAALVVGALTMARRSWSTR